MMDFSKVPDEIEVRGARKKEIKYKESGIKFEGQRWTVKLKYGTDSIFIDSILINSQYWAS
jgi:hypothetical protein